MDQEKTSIPTSNSMVVGRWDISDTILLPRGNQANLLLVDVKDSTTSLEDMNFCSHNCNIIISPSLL